MKKKHTLHRIYDAFLNGDALTDGDLAAGIAGFECLAHMARQAGPTFQLTAREAQRVVIALQDFEAARKRNK